MKGLIQRVSHANVDVDGQSVGRIESGLLLLLGVDRQDNAETAAKLCQRVVNCRMFPDQTGRMNLSLKDAGGSILIVPQFTLVADTRRGNRPSFSSAGSPEHASALFQEFTTEAISQLGKECVATGEFGADMKVSLLNDGPVTFLLEVE